MVEDLNTRIYYKLSEEFFEYTPQTDMSRLLLRLEHIGVLEQIAGHNEGRSPVALEIKRWRENDLSRNQDVLKGLANTIYNLMIRNVDTYVALMNKDTNIEKTNAA